MSHCHKARLLLVQAQQIGQSLLLKACFNALVVIVNWLTETRPEQAEIGFDINFSGSPTEIYF